MIDDLKNIQRLGALVPVTGRLLVVDDDRLIRSLLRKILEIRGCDIDEADSGARALEMACAGNYDLILLDIGMPGLDGAEVLRRLKQDETTQHMPVVMVSAAGADDRVAECLLGGAEDFLHKPINTVLLNARVTACLEQKALRDRERSALAELRDEKARSENLLLNIFPKKIIEQLADKERTIADLFEDVSVLFADIVGFTRIAAKMSPEALLENLNKVFSAFDGLSQEFGVEKIKTIGDAYMAACGLPEPRADHAVAIADMALGMIECLEDVNRSLRMPFGLRIGIHTGPVIAGVIGTHKYVYDIWGDTVNRASRYESYSTTNRIHVSREFAELLPDDYVLESRGVIEMRGCGEAETFFLRHRKKPGGFS